MFKFLAKIIRGFFDWVGGLFGGDTNERELKKLQPIVDRINSLETEFQKLTNEELRGKTSEFRQR